MSRYFSGLQCVDCETSYQPDPAMQSPCPACGGILDVIYDYERIKGEVGNGLWRRGGREPTTVDSMVRYGPLLPVDDPGVGPPLTVGVTPLTAAPRLASRLGLGELLAKEDHRLPTGSLKDRASWVAVARARELGINDVVCASTGNAASSLAGMAASVGTEAHILVPTEIPLAKLAQVESYGADVMLIDAPYDDVYYLCNQVAEEFGWYNRNCAINPYLVEGKKTSGLELAEQLGPSGADWVAVSVGDGCTIAGIWKGISELRELGAIERLPRMLGVQALGASPLVDAFESDDGKLATQTAHTVASAIAVGRPRNATKALRAVEQSGGSLVAVSDEQIVEGRQLLADHAGVLAELGAAAALAGVVEARSTGLIESGSRVAVVVTGHGLKDDSPPRPDSIDSLACDIGEVRKHQARNKERQNDGGNSGSP